MKDTQSGYIVPAHYFGDLKGSIMARVGDPSMSTSTATSASPLTSVSPSISIESATTWSMAFRRMGAFAAGFLLLVALAGTVFYFTADRAQKGETVDRVQELCLLYDVDEDDILEYSSMSADGALVADLAISYVELYGYPVE